MRTVITVVRRRRDGKLLVKLDGSSAVRAHRQFIKSLRSGKTHPEYDMVMTCWPSRTVHLDAPDAEKKVEAKPVAKAMQAIGRAALSFADRIKGTRSASLSKALA